MTIYDKINVITYKPNPKAHGHIMYVLILKQLTAIQLKINIYLSKYFLS